jgi:hypothetical protein
MTSEGEFDHGKREYYFFWFYLVTEGISGKWLRFECLGLGSCVPKLAKGLSNKGRDALSKSRCFGKCTSGHRGVENATRRCAYFANIFRAC